MRAAKHPVGRRSDHTETTLPVSKGASGATFGCPKDGTVGMCLEVGDEGGLDLEGGRAGRVDWL